MKTRFYIVIAMGIYLICLGALCNSLAQDDEYKIEAIYSGLSDSDMYEFIDDNQEILLFDYLSSEIEIDLSDEANIDKRFLVTWIEEEEMPDEEGEIPGEAKIIKTIIGLEEL